MLVLCHDRHLARDITCSSASARLGSRKTSGENGGSTGDDGCVVVVLFIGVEVVDVKVEVGAVAESADVDYVSLELKDGDTSAIKGHSLYILLVLEPEENGRRHG